MSKLFEEDSGSDQDLKVNNDYAKSYDNWRQKEEYNKLKTKYLLDSDESSSSSDDEDDDDNLANVLGKEFLKTLSCLKNKDPRIYDQNVKFFEIEDNPVKKVKKEKPLFINDYDRKVILSGNQSGDDNDSEKDDNNLTYVKEQEMLKNNFQEALKSVDDEDEESDIFKLKMQQENEKEEKFKNWLCGDKVKLENDDEKDLKPLKEFWSDPKLDNNEKFLRDYILNKRFLEQENSSQNDFNNDIISDDETTLEKQDTFEQKYNFRFEEPDQEFIKRYPRTLQNSLRSEDDRRKVKRAEVKERKQKEKMQKMEDLKQLQAFKHKEIEEKIKKLQEITGNTDLGFKEDDIDGDFDPEAHDKRMKNLFDDEFYEGPEGEQKPEFSDIDEEIENWDHWDGQEKTTEENELHCEDEGFNMDCDYDPATVEAEKEIESSNGKKKRKRKSKFAKLVSQPKPVFDPKDKTYQQYLDEYYKFDCEDIIGDIPCKFKYREVMPNNFGLTVEEILLAKDKELNRWCSLKKAVQHRPEHIEKYDQIAYEKKGKNENLKKKVLPSLFIDEEKVVDQTKSTTNNMNKNLEEDVEQCSSKELPQSSQISMKKRRRKRKLSQNDDNEVSVKQKKLDGEQNQSINANNVKLQESAQSSQKIIKKKRSQKGNNKLHARKTTEKQEVGISNARLSAYGISKKKFKKKMLHQKKR